MLRRAIVVLALAAASLAAAHGGAGRYLGADDFLAGAFPGGVPAPQTLWLTGELRERVERVLGHPVTAIRMRCWFDGRTSAFIMDEIGKELPITIGVAVMDGAVSDVRILEFRESRGWEVRFPFFTDQFRLSRLADDDRLDRRIDGITGATLSVGAVKRVVQVALLLHEQVASNP